ncbi:MAG TPA: homoserine dehydrogenase [Verrucomicrobiae bacterium]|nr:homoserine dehydrogenase [Verrucomicrobiae bacterium]
MARALLRMLIAKETELRRKYDVRWRLTGVASRRIGWISDPDGMNPLAALAGHFPNHMTQLRNVREWLEHGKTDVLFEMTSLNAPTGQPAIDHLKAALEAGAHAITANKGPVVHGYSELTEMAKEKQRQFLFESTVMDGVPIFSFFSSGLPVTELRGFSGVLNSTSNVVLTEVERGKSFEEGVKRAQAMGIAETDPTQDLDGWDSAVKVAAITTVLMGVPTHINQVQRTGIRQLTEEKIRSVRTAGMRYKLVCRAERRGDGVDCRVAPELLLLSDPLAALEGTSSAIRFDLDPFGLSLVEHNPGLDATAYGLLADFVRAVEA